jgi:PhnB protein
LTSIEPDLWVDAASEAVSFYQAAFGATTLHRVGDGDDIVVRLEVGDARFWIAPARSELGRLSPNQIGGRTSRTLLIVDDPDAMVKQAIEAGSTEDAPVGEEHGWRVGRIVDPYGHEWEIGKPLGE